MHNFFARLWAGWFFPFKRHPTINWPEERIVATEKQVRARARQLFQLPRERELKTRP